MESEIKRWLKNYIKLKRLVRCLNSKRVYSAFRYTVIPLVQIWVPHSNKKENTKVIIAFSDEKNKRPWEFQYRDELWYIAVLYIYSFIRVK